MALESVAKGITPGRTVVGRIVLARGSDRSYDLGNCAGGAVKAVRGERREVKVERDGSFRLENLSPGVWDLALEAWRTKGGGRVAAAGAAGYGARGGVQGGSLARVRCRFEVKDADGGTIDLGPFEIEVPRMMTGNQAAPPFQCATMEGEEVDLWRLRGKFVVLEFWASWCGFCRQEMPAMKKLYEEHGQDPRLVMVGLNLDRDLGAAEDYVAKNGVKWTQGILGNWSRDNVSFTYGVKEIPTILLVGPDGRIMAKCAKGEEMRQAVAEALRDGNAR